MSHLACADDPALPMNAQQLKRFETMTEGLPAPRSLAATGGVLMGPAYHFDLTRPGIGLYGGLPFIDARPVVQLDVPVIQVRDVAAGETVGYANAWTATEPSRIATISAGYADGLIRAMGPKAVLHAGGTAVPVVGRVSMDLIGVDVTALPGDPDNLQMIGPHQSVDTVAGFSDTIGYEVLTSLGARYRRVYVS
jgi:alanine racemase